MFFHPFYATISIIYILLIILYAVFSCKLQGKRKRADKAGKLVKELLEEGCENDDKNNPSNVTPKQQTKD